MLVVFDCTLTHLWYSANSGQGSSASASWLNLQPLPALQAPRAWNLQATSLLAGWPLCG
jgi:hypothetical protein